MTHKLTFCTLRMDPLTGTSTSCRDTTSVASDGAPQQVSDTVLNLLEAVKDSFFSFFKRSFVSDHSCNGMVSFNVIVYDLFMGFIRLFSIDKELREIYSGILCSIVSVTFPPETRSYVFTESI